MQLEPSTKRRRLGPDGSFDSQSSFVDVLEGFKVEAGDVGEEGGADSWARPLLPNIDEKNDSIIFQQIDVQVDSTDGINLQMFGVTEGGHSVLAIVTGFVPYFYVPVPLFANVDLSSLVEYLNQQTAGTTVRMAEIVKKRSLRSMGNDRVSFIKITTTDPNSVPKRGKCTFRGLFHGPTPTFESNMHFMIDTKVAGMNWIEVPAGKYKLVAETAKSSHCQLEFHVRYDSFTSHAPEGRWSKVAPLRILSFDIECVVRGEIFPEAKIDPVIQIANMVTRQGEQQPFIRNVFTLNSCAHIVGSQVLAFDDEAKLLHGWREFVEEVDPDVVIGYNIANFDFPYLIDRAKVVQASKFPLLGRFKNVKAQVLPKVYGQRDFKETTLDGRLQLDVLQLMRREHKLPSYTLNSVCTQFLGEQKEGVHYSHITELQNGTSESRRRLAVYCLKDAYLPQRLLDKLVLLVNYIEMSRMMGVPFNFLTSRGQSIKVLSQLYRKANEEGYIVPTMKREGISLS